MVFGSRLPLQLSGYIRHVIGRARAVCRVLSDAQPAAIALLVIATACVFGSALSEALSDGGLNATIRHSGMILQICGLAGVALGLRRMRQEFGKPSLANHARNWVRRFGSAFKSPAPILLRADAAGAIGIVGGDLRARRGAGSGATVEQRLDVLTENLRLLEEEFDRRVKHLDDKSAELSKALLREGSARKAAYERTSRQIENVAVGGLHLEWAGLLWLILGVVGTSMPDELAGILGYLADSLY